MESAIAVVLDFVRGLLLHSACLFPSFRNFPFASSTRGRVCLQRTRVRVFSTLEPISFMPVERPKMLVFLFAQRRAADQWSLLVAFPEGRGLPVCRSYQSSESRSCLF